MVLVRTVLLLLIALSGLVVAQTRTTTAPKIPANSITIDGNLDEYFWVTGGLGEKIRIDQSTVIYGAIDNDADCHAEFKTFWNDNGVYVGTWFYDDVHNAMNSQYLDAANIAYDDDGLEYWFDYNFDDAWNSTATNKPQYYLQLIKGFGNLDPSTQYGGWWGGDDGSGKGWSTGIKTVAEQQAMGWHEVFTSADGLNYTSELLIEWSGSIMHQVGSMAQGAGIAFDMKVDDNDGAFSIEGASSWTGLDHQKAYGLHYGKVTLGAAAGVRPVLVKGISRPMSAPEYVCDILGRRIAADKQNFGGRVLLAPSRWNGKALRSAVLR